MLRVRWRLAAAACFVAATGVFMLLFGIPQPHPAGGLEVVDARTQPTHEALSGPAERIQAGAPGIADSQNTQFSLASKVRDLSNSTSPADALRAYNILVECKWAREEEKSFTLTRRADRDSV